MRSSTIVTIAFGLFAGSMLAVAMNTEQVELSDLNSDDWHCEHTAGVFPFYVESLLCERIQ